MSLTSVGFATVISTLLGFWFGLYLDGVFGTAPWLMILFLILGVIAGFRSIYMTIKKAGFETLMSVTTRFVSVMSKKALLADAIFGLLGAAACALIGKAMIIGFAVGLIIGVFNQYLYFSAAGKRPLFPR